MAIDNRKLGVKKKVELKKNKKESKRDISGEYSFKNIWKCIKNTKWTQ